MDFRSHLYRLLCAEHVAHSTQHYTARASFPKRTLRALQQKNRRCVGAVFIPACAWGGGNNRPKPAWVLGFSEAFPKLREITRLTPHSIREGGVGGGLFCRAPILR